MDNDDGRRTRLQQRLENAVARGDLDIDEYSRLCATVWDAAHDEDSPALDAIAGRLERLDEEWGRRRSGHGAPPHGGGHRSPKAPGTGPGPAALYGGPAPSNEPRRNPPAGRYTVGATPSADRQKGAPTIFGTRDVGGSWAPQPETTWWSVFGETKIDLTEADFPGPRLVLDLQSSFSEVRVTVPRGTRVIVDATCILSDVKHRRNSNTDTNGLTVVIDGVVIFGELKIRER